MLASVMVCMLGALSTATLLSSFLYCACVPTGSYVAMLYMGSAARPHRAATGSRAGRTRARAS
jgi:hypothetical protein